MSAETHPAVRLDETVHQRARLGILAILSQVKQADFASIRSTLELTAGNLSQHLNVLEEAGLIKVSKVFEGKKPRTWLAMTPAGRRAYAAELETLRSLIENAEPS